MTDSRRVIRVPSTFSFVPDTSHNVYPRIPTYSHELWQSTPWFSVSELSPTQVCMYISQIRVTRYADTLLRSAMVLDPYAGRASALTANTIVNIPTDRLEVLPNYLKITLLGSKHGSTSSSTQIQWLLP